MPKHPVSNLDKDSAAFELTLSEFRSQHWGVEERQPRGGFPEEHDLNREASVSALSSIRAAASEHGAVIKEGVVRTKQLNVHYYDMGVTYHVFNNIVLSFLGAGGVAAVLKATQPALVQWLKNLGGRSITLKSGNVMATIKGSNDIDDALKALRQLAPTRPGSQKVQAVTSASMKTKSGTRAGATRKKKTASKHRSTKKSGMIRKPTGGETEG